MSEKIFNDEVGEVNNLKELKPETENVSGGYSIFFDRCNFSESLVSLANREVQKGRLIIGENGKVEKVFAPNGQNSLLFEKLKSDSGERIALENWLKVRSVDFKAWFGDWENVLENSSKIVDENGEPLVVFHSTNDKNIESFQDDHSENENSKNKGVGVFCSEKKQTYGSEFYQLFIDIKNPVLASDEDAIEILGGKKAEGVNYNIYGDYIDTTSLSAEARRKLQELGYDGMLSKSQKPDVEKAKKEKNEMLDLIAGGDNRSIVKLKIEQLEKIIEGNYKEVFEEILAFESNQIKSAVDNDGNFDKNSDKIRE